MENEASICTEMSAPGKQLHSEATFQSYCPVPHDMRLIAIDEGFEVRD